MENHKKPTSLIPNPYALTAVRLKTDLPCGHKVEQKTAAMNAAVFTVRKTRIRYYQA